MTNAILFLPLTMCWLLANQASGSLILLQWSWYISSILPKRLIQWSFLRSAFPRFKEGLRNRGSPDTAWEVIEFDWFKSYITKRNRKTVVDGCLSDACPRGQRYERDFLLDVLHVGVKKWREPQSINVGKSDANSHQLVRPTRVHYRTSALYYIDKCSTRKYHALQYISLHRWHSPASLR